MSVLWPSLPDLKGSGTVSMNNWPTGGTVTEFVSPSGNYAKVTDFEMFPVMKAANKGVSRRCYL